MSKVTVQNDITQYLGYCWKRSTILVENNNIANPNIPNHVLFIVILRIATIIVANKAPIDRNIPTGNTALNLFSALSACNAFIQIHISVGIHMKLSPNIINIHIGTIAKLNAKNNISTHIFLFSILGIFLRKIMIAINIQSNIHTKWKLYQYGESNFSISLIPIDKLPFSSNHVVSAPNTYVSIVSNGNR